MELDGVNTFTIVDFLKIIRIIREKIYNFESDLFVYTRNI